MGVRIDRAIPTRRKVLISRNLATRSARWTQATRSQQADRSLALQCLAQITEPPWMSLISYIP
jgi:hypothetical protein